MLCETYRPAAISRAEAVPGQPAQHRELALGQVAAARPSPARRAGRRPTGVARQAATRSRLTAPTAPSSSAPAVLGAAGARRADRPPARSTSAAHDARVRLLGARAAAARRGSPRGRPPRGRPSWSPRRRQRLGQRRRAPRRRGGTPSGAPRLASWMRLARAALGQVDLALLDVGAAEVARRRPPTSGPASHGARADRLLEDRARLLQLVARVERDAQRQAGERAPPGVARRLSATPGGRRSRRPPRRPPAGARASARTRCAAIDQRASAGRSTARPRPPPPRPARARRPPRARG